MGALIAEALRRRWRLPPALAIALAVLGFAALLSLPNDRTWQGVTWGVPAAAVVWGAVSLEDRLAPLLPAVWLAIGDASYAIYLVHGFVIAAFMHALSAHPSLAALPLPAVVAGSLVLSSLAGWFVHVAIEKPIAVRLRQRRRPRAALITAA